MTSPKKQHYENHLDAQTLASHIESKKLVHGKLRINAKRPSDSYVTVDGLFSQPASPPSGFKRDVYIDGRTSRNRALEGDDVVVRLDAAASVPDIAQLKIKQSADDGPSSSILSSEIPAGASAFHRDAMPARSGPDYDQRGSDDSAPQPTGKIVGILVRHEQSREAVGVLTAWSDDGVVRPNDRRARFIPVDRRAPHMIISLKLVPPEFRDDPESFKKRMFLARIVSWESSSNLPHGELAREIGASGDIETETEAILSDNGISQRGGFPEEALANLPAVDEGAVWQIPPEELGRRRDCREWRIFTIDPPTAKDLDDALSCRALPDGGWEIGVHIADVSHFVPIDSALDREAFSRATTVYLVQRAIPMLPSLLSQDLCSLNPNVDRLAFSVVWQMDKDGIVTSEWFGRTVIRSCARMSYGQAQVFIDEANESVHEDAGPSLVSALPIEPPPPVVPTGGHSLKQVGQDVLALHRLACRMRKARFQNGAVRLNRVKLTFVRDEQGMPIDVASYKLADSNHLVEEFMLLANYSVARRLVHTFPHDSLLRRHAAPLGRKMEEMMKDVERLGFAINGRTAAHLERSLRSALAAAKKDQHSARIGPPPPPPDDPASLTPAAQRVSILRELDADDIAVALEMLATRPMQTAKYFCTGTMDPPQFRHYALNIAYYTHFTSPIRRYADVMVHRLLDAAIRADGAMLPVSHRGLGGDQKAELVPVAGPATAAPPIAFNKSLEEVAQQCNDKKASSKKAQEGCDALFLALLLKRRGAVEAKGMLVGIGKQSFTVAVPSYGLEKRVYVEDIEGVSGSLWNEEKRVLTLLWGIKAGFGHRQKLPKPKGRGGKGRQKEKVSIDMAVDSQVVRMMSPVRVMLEADAKAVPMDVKVSMLKDEGAMSPHGGAGAA